MPALFSAFSTMLTAFQTNVTTNLLAKIAKTTLYPLTVTLLTLIAIVSFDTDTNALADWWTIRSPWLQGLLGVVVVVALVFLAYALNSLEPVLMAAFQGHPLDNLGPWVASRHRRRWTLRHAEYERWEAVTALLQAVHDRAVVYSQPASVRSVSDLAVGAFVTSVDVRDVASAATALSLTRAKDAFGRLVTRAIKAGEPLPNDALTAAVSGSADVLSDVQYVAVTVAANLVPDGLRAGDRVALFRLMTSATVDPAPIGAGPLLIANVRPAGSTGGATQQGDQLVLTVAVAKGDVANVLSVASKGQLAVTRIVPDELTAIRGAACLVTCDERSKRGTLCVAYELTDAFQSEVTNGECSVPIAGIHTDVVAVLVPKEVEGPEKQCPRVVRVQFCRFDNPRTPEKVWLIPYAKDLPGAIWVVAQLVARPWAKYAERPGEVETITVRLLLQTQVQSVIVGPWLEQARHAFTAQAAYDMLLQWPFRVLALCHWLDILAREAAEQKAAEQKGVKQKQTEEKETEQKEASPPDCTVTCRGGLEMAAKTLRSGIGAVMDRRDKAHQYFRLYYPSHFSEVASTRIGNILRSVDSYVEDIYGMDASLILGRLPSVQAADPMNVTDPRNQLAFLEWSCLGVVVVDLFGTLFSVHQGHWNLATGIWVGASLLASLMYAATIQAALQYAQSLRMAFDAQRGKVLDALGLLPGEAVTEDQEKNLWRDVTQWLEYGLLPATRSYRIKSDGGGAPAGGASAGAGTNAGSSGSSTPPGGAK